MEITLTEMFLLVWAVVATLLYFSSKHDAYVSKKVLWHLLNDADDRAKVLDSFEHFKRKAGAK